MNMFPTGSLLSYGITVSACVVMIVCSGTAFVATVRTYNEPHIFYRYWSASCAPASYWAVLSLSAVTEVVAAVHILFATRKIFI
jgi:hypothetical protein